MTRRKSVLLVAVGAVLVLGVAPYVFFHPRRLNHDGFVAVQDGMTQREVEELLGGPPGAYYPSHPGPGWTTMTKEGYSVPGAVERVWSDDKRRYEIWFSDEGRVVGKHRRSGWDTPSHLCRLTGWLFGQSEPRSLEPKRSTVPPAR